MNARAYHRALMYRMKCLTYTIIVLIALAFVAIALHGQDAGVLRVHFIDVGQGDSILIQSSDTTILIDGGYDNGLALAYSQSIGVSHVNALIASHSHADHIGGLTQVMQALPVDAVWTNGAVHTTYTFEQFIDTIAEHGIPYFEAGTNDVITVGDLVFDVVSGQSSAADLNDTSLVLHLTYGQVSFLFTGDAERAAEQQMLQTIDPSRLAATILKVGHHGSYTSSSPEFLSVVQPQIAVYSAGRNNEYGHPHHSTLEALLQAGAAIYGTDEYGTIVVESTLDSYSIRDSAGVSLPARRPEPLTVVENSEVTPFTDQDCGAFATHEMAYDFFIAAGGPEADPHGLDGDNDGIPCESLPRESQNTEALWQGELPYDPFGRDRNCSAFATHETAQAFFIAAGGPERDPHRLDGDNDGIACESLP